MVFFLLFLLLVVFNNAKFSNSNTFMEDYLSKEKTNAIKGIFVILIIFSHFSQYVELGGIYDEAYVVLKNHLNQMVVSMFFFYSGYGMMEATKRKGFRYIKGIPVKRLLVVLIQFDIAVVLYLIVGYFLNTTYDIPTILWSLIGWKSVGNSNWYIFAILVLYVIYFAAFLVLKWYDKKISYYICAILLTVGTIIFVYSQIKLGRPAYCYNTMILLPLGCWYSLLKKWIQKVAMRNDIVYTPACFLMLVLYLVSFQYRWSGGIEVYTIWAISFTLLVVLASMKISFCNPVLSWFGNHVFSVYILQRIPMMILQYAGLSANHKYIFLILVLVSTVLLAQIFDYFTGKLSKIIIGTYQRHEDRRDIRLTYEN